LLSVVVSCGTSWAIWAGGDLITLGVCPGDWRIVERRKVIVSGFDRGDCEGFLTFSQRRAKRYSSGLLVACVSSSCVGCVRHPITG
jgi:hypothetical protein